MPEARKATTRADDLTLYALAQARGADVHAACKDACKGCPGPLADDGCATRAFPRAVAGRADWPMCPLGMLRVPLWESVVDLYQAAKISPLANFPDRLTAGAFTALLELRNAVHREDERRIEEARKPNSSASWSGRRVARGNA